MKNKRDKRKNITLMVGMVILIIIVYSMSSCSSHQRTALNNKKYNISKITKRNRNAYLTCPTYTNMVIRKNNYNYKYARHKSKR